MPLDQEINAFGRAISWMPVRAAVTSCGRCRWLQISQRADPAQGRVGGALAAFPGAVDGAPQRLMRGFAGEEHAADRLASGFFATAARRAPAADIAPSTNGAAFQRVALDFFTAAADLAAEQLRQPFLRERDHRLLALRGEIAAERARDIDRAQRGTADIGVASAPSASNCSAR